MRTASRLSPVTDPSTPIQMGPDLPTVLAEYVTETGETLLDAMLAAHAEIQEVAA